MTELPKTKEEMRDQLRKAHELKTCKLKVVDDPTSKFGKRLEAECVSRDAAVELSDLLQEEVIIRVKPAGAVQEEEPAVVTES